MLILLDICPRATVGHSVLEALTLPATIPPGSSQPPWSVLFLTLTCWSRSRFCLPSSSVLTFHAPADELVHSLAAVPASILSWRNSDFSLLSSELLICICNCPLPCLPGISVQLISKGAPHSSKPLCSGSSLRVSHPHDQVPASTQGTSLRRSHSWPLVLTHTARPTHQQGFSVRTLTGTCLEVHVRAPRFHCRGIRFVPWSGN